MPFTQPTEVFQLSLGPLSAHAFNGQRNQVAVSPNTNEIHIYHWEGGSWKLAHTLKGVSIAPFVYFKMYKVFYYDIHITCAHVEGCKYHCTFSLQLPAYLLLLTYDLVA
jgi:hypothetical protein